MTGTDTADTRTPQGPSGDQIFDPLLDWLGFRDQTVSVGVHITSDNITLVALKARPLRLVAVGRASVRDAAVIGNEIRLAAPVSEALAALVTEARIAPGSLTIAAVEPLANSFTIWERGQEALTYNVVESTYSRIGQVCESAGLPLARVDLVPAAMARLGRVAGVGTVAGRAPNGWTVRTEDGFTDAVRSDHGAPAGAPLSTLGSIRVPRRFGHLIDPAADAAAIGAALAGFSHEPIVSTQPVSEAVGPDWVVQHVESADDDHAPDPEPWPADPR